jgi:Na+-driven multidrug efflux pump
MNFIKKISKTNLFKIASLNSISVLIKIGIGLLTSKVLAIFIGPSGMALVGNFRNFLTTTESVSTLGFQNGIVKYVAESKENNTELKKIFSTLFFSIFSISFLIGIVLFLFADNFNLKIFGNSYHFEIVFKVLALVLPFYTISILLVSILNGLGFYKRVVYITIFGTFLGIILTVFLIYKMQIVGSLLAIVATPAFLFFVTFYYFSKQFSISEYINFHFFDINILQNLSHYFFMAMVSGLLGPLTYLAIRSQTITTLGIENAGFWESISRISGYYMLFVNTLLTLYYYPKLILAKTNQETKLVFWSFYKNVLSLFSIALVFIYFLRFFIINSILTPEFEPVSKLFFWQLIGDFFKAASWILAFQFFAKKLTKTFIFTEILSLAILYFSSLYWLTIFRTEGLVIAHAFTYFCYLLVLGIYFRKSIF